MITNKKSNQRDRIINYLTVSGKGGDDLPMLTKKDQERLDRILQMRALFLQYKIKRKTIDVFRAVTGVSESLAYIDFREMEHVLGSVRAVSKEFKRQMVEEAAWELHVKALAAKQFVAAKGALDVIVKVSRLDQPDEKAIDYSQFEAPPVRIGFYPEKVARQLPPDKELIPLLKKLAGKNNDITLKIEQFTKDIESIEYDEDPD